MDYIYEDLYRIKNRINEIQTLKELVDKDFVRIGKSLDKRFGLGPIIQQYSSEDSISVTFLCREIPKGFEEFLKENDLEHHLKIIDGEIKLTIGLNLRRV